MDPGPEDMDPGPVTAMSAFPLRAGIGNNDRMPDFPRAVRGYDRAEVDARIARIEGTRGRRTLFAPPVTADEVSAARFRRTLFGYRMRPVDVVLVGGFCVLVVVAGGFRLVFGVVV